MTVYINFVLCQGNEIIKIARIIYGVKCNITGNQIKNVRRKVGLSQRTLSDKLETYAVYICRGSISRIERG